MNIWSLMAWNMVLNTSIWIRLNSKKFHGPPEMKKIILKMFYWYELQKIHQARLTETRVFSVNFSTKLAKLTRKVILLFIIWWNIIGKRISARHYSLTYCPELLSWTAERWKTILQKKTCKYNINFNNVMIKHNYFSVDIYNTE